MVKKFVRDLILEKFADLVGKDELFYGISDDLFSLSQQGKLNKSEITNLLRKRE